MELSRRLAAIAEMVEEGSRLADVEPITGICRSGW